MNKEIEEFEQILRDNKSYIYISNGSCIMLKYMPDMWYPFDEEHIYLYREDNKTTWDTYGRKTFEELQKIYPITFDELKKEIVKNL